jgi:hypothetical protein
MSTATTNRQPDRVAEWPRLSASIDGVSGRILRGSQTYIGSITINGTQHPCEAPSSDELRTGMIARAVAIAIRLRRPVRLSVQDNGCTWVLGIRPEGFVQLVDDNGTITSPDGLAVQEARCRVCRRLQPVIEAVCIQCCTPEPFRVEMEPLDAAEPAPVAVLEPEDFEDDPLAQLRDEVDEHTVYRSRSTPPATPPRPTLRLTFNTTDPVELNRNAAIGRRPEAVDGRQPVGVPSPERRLSRTHALVDVDEEGRIVVTDHHSGNGIEVEVDPPTIFSPDVPYVIEPGTTLIMGDVVCTIDIVAAA